MQLGKKHFAFLDQFKAKRVKGSSLSRPLQEQSHANTFTKKYKSCLFEYSSGYNLKTNKQTKL